MGAFAPVTSEISRSYNSLSGTDIRAIIGTREFAEIQAISYSITREKAPIYTMGSANPRAFSRNKRGIAGSLVWINFDRHALLALINDQGGTFVANMDEIRPQYSISDGTFIGQSTIFNANITNSLGIPASATIQQASSLPISNVSDYKDLATPWASDQILPLITVAAFSCSSASAERQFQVADC